MYFRRWSPRRWSSCRAIRVEDTTLPRTFDQSTRILCGTCLAVPSRLSSYSQNVRLSASPLIESIHVLLIVLATEIRSIDADYSIEPRNLRTTTTRSSLSLLRDKPINVHIHVRSDNICEHHDCNKLRTRILYMMKSVPFEDQRYERSHPLSDPHLTPFLFHMVSSFQKFKTKT